MSILPTACSHPGCPEITKERFCHKHKGYEKAVQKDYESRREHDPFYNSPQWRKARKMHLARHPLCQDCLDEGIITASKPGSPLIVDHVEEIKDGGRRLDPKNFRTRCQEHHNRKTGETRKRRNKDG